MSMQGSITGEIIFPENIRQEIRGNMFEDLHRVLMKEWKRKWISRYEMYRGNELQCEVLSPGHTLRLALVIRSFCKAYVPGVINKRGYSTAVFDARIAMSIAPPGIYGNASGLSGGALDELKKTSRKMALRTTDKCFDEQIAPLLPLTDALIEKWTQNQAELVLYKLQNKKEEEIAALLNISQSAVSQRTKTAHWSAIEHLVGHFEKTAGSKLAVYSVPAHTPFPGRH